MNKYTAPPLSETFFGDFIAINGVRFTPREIDVIAYLFNSKDSTKVIADALSIALKTTETHIRNIFSKTRSRSREALINFIKKSNQNILVNRHYEAWQNYTVFKKVIKRVQKMVNPSKNTCLVVYDLSCKNLEALALEIVDFLIQAGFKSSKEAQNLTNNMTDLLRQALPRSVDKVIYIFPGERLKGSINPIINQYHPQHSFAPLHQTAPPIHDKLFVLHDRKENTPIPKDLQKDNHIELREGETGYRALTNLLKQLTPEKESEWKEIESSSKWYEENSSRVLESPPAEPKEEKQKFSIPFASTKLFSISNLTQVKKVVGLGLVIILSMVLVSLFKQSKSPSSIIHSNLIIPPEMVLLNRQTILTQIAKKMKETESVQEGIQNIILIGIAGMGGVGKTTIARQFGRLYKASVVWEINAETQTTLMASFKDLAYELAKTDDQKKQLIFIENIKNAEEKEKQLFLFIRQHLKEHPNWLLIYDNVESFAAIKPYFPADPHLWGYGKVVVTTRDANMEYSNYVKSAVIHIEELNEQECLTLFSKILYKKELSQLTSSQKKEALVFLKNIPPFPLDISTAAYYIKNNRLNYQQYLERIAHFNPDFYHSQETLLKEISDYAKTRYGIIISSLAKIIESDKDFQGLLLLISLLDSQSIPRSLLEFYKNPALVDSFIHELKKYSLITAETKHVSAQPSTFSIHRSTQDICRSYLTRNLNSEEQKETSFWVSTILEKYLNHIIDKESIKEISLLKNHCCSFLTNCILSDDIKGTLEFALGCIYYHLGENTKAQQAFEKSLLLPSKTENDARKAKTFMYLGTIYRDFGKFELSKKFLEQSVEIYREKFPNQQINIARILMHLGNVYKDLSDPEKAKETLEESLLIFQQNPDNKAGLPRVLAYLGTVYRELGQYKKAQELLEKSVSIYNKQPNNPLGLALSLARLGNLYRELGDYEKAKSCLEKSLDIYRKNSSKNNVNFGWVLSYLGSVYGDLGYYEKAKEFFEEGLAIHQKNYKEDNINVGWVLTYLGCTYLTLNDYENAKNCLEKSLSIYEKNYKSAHISIGWASLYLGIAHKHLGNSEKAELFLNRSFYIYENYFTENKVDIAWIFPYVGDIYRKLGTYIYFKPFNENLLASYEKRYGECHLRTALVLKSIGEVYLMKKENEKAEVFLKRSLCIFEKINHPDRYRVLESLAFIYEQKTIEAGKNEQLKQTAILKGQAIQYLSQALAITQTEFSHESAHVKRIKIRLGQLENGISAYHLQNE